MKAGDRKRLRAYVLLRSDRRALLKSVKVCKGLVILLILTESLTDLTEYRLLTFSYVK